MTIDKSGDDDTLMNAAKKVAEANRQKQEEKNKMRENIRSKRQRFMEAESSLLAIQKKFFDRIKSASNEIVIKDSVLSFGEGKIQIKFPLLYIPDLNTNVQHGVIKTSQMYEKLGFEAIAVSYIYVSCAVKRSNRSATLLYLRERESKVFRWYTISFKDNPFSSLRHSLNAPFSLEPNSFDIYQAISIGMHVVDVVTGPYPVDNEDYGSFEKYWISVLSSAAVGELTFS